MKFRYTALSSDNQKLTGVLESENQDGAQKELHKMGVSIISIKEITDAEDDEIKKKKVTEKEKSGVSTFNFLAIDKGGKEINGTIDARDSYSAYKRLITEYGFKISELYPSSATDAEKTDANKKIPEFETRIKEEGIDVTTEKASADDELLEASDKIDKKIIEEIDHFIINTKKVITEHSYKFSPPFLKQIESTLGELERIRTSNNIKHITETCNQIYELISNPDQLPESQGEQADSSYDQIINSLQNTGIVKKQFNIHSKAVGLSKLKSLFGKVFGKLKQPGNTEKKESVLSKIFSKFGKKKVPDLNKPVKAVKKQGIIGIFFSYISAPNTMLRKARKQELKKVFNEWKESRKSKKAPGESVKEEAMLAKSDEKIQTKDTAEDKITEEAIEMVEENEETASVEKWKAPAFFSELDSFLGWLLFFYIIYFFLIDFSFEKNIGIPREFVAKTLKTPLIIDITIFLLVTHLLFKLRGSLFKGNVLGSVFLFLFGLGFYSLIILNF